MLTIAGVIGLVAIVLKIAGKKFVEDLDNISIASELSTSSCSTVGDVDIVTEKRQNKDLK